MSIIVTYNELNIKPAPKISFKSDIFYANDNTIGNQYAIVLNGISIAENSNLDFVSTIQEINNIREILSYNGSTLIISDTKNGILLKAIGGILNDFTINNTNNNWSKYASYTATLTFNEINILNDSYACNNSIIQSNIDSHLLNVNDYKIKEFKDSWTISLTDNIFNYYDNKNQSPTNNYEFFYNTQINVQYTISAAGITYFDESAEVVPAWIQSKKFVQKRLYNQIKNFYDKYNILNEHGSGTCQVQNTLNSIHTNNTIKILDSNMKYNIFDETISCSTSESEGTFSATYNAILKYDDSDSNSFSTSKSIHDFNKTINTTIEGQKTNTTIRIEGTIQGLNAIDSGNHIVFDILSLPEDGKLFNNKSNNNKMSNANQTLEHIIDETKNDLILPFKSGLLIDSTNLNFNSCSGIMVDNIKPVLFNLTKNYFLGNINYAVEYNTDRLGVVGTEEDQLVYTTVIDIDRPIPIYAELPIPGGKYIIQDLETTTAEKFNITITGRKKRKCCLDNFTKNDILDLLNTFNFPLPDDKKIILTNKNIAYNIFTGVFNITGSFMCQSGCFK